MRLLKIVTVFFVIYFVRRFIQKYNALKQMHEKKEHLMKKTAGSTNTRKKPDSVDVDFRVVD